MVTARDQLVHECWAPVVGGDAAPTVPIDLRSLAGLQGRRTEPA